MATEQFVKDSGKMEDKGYLDRFMLSLVNSSEDAIIGESLQGIIVSWNPAAEKIFGYSAEEAIGKPMKMIGPTNKSKEFDDLLDKVKKGENIQRYETVRKKKDGTLINVSVTISPIKDDKGKVIGLSAIDRDISSQKQSAGYARSLIEASLDPLVTISTDGKVTDVNQATMDVTGASRQELIGSSFSDYFTEPTKAEEGYQKVFKEGVVKDYPLTIKHRNGKLADVLYNASVYKDTKGKVLGVFAAARDITEQKQATQYARSLIEASLDPLVTISPDGKVTDVNQATIEATGFTREEIVGTDFSDYFTEPSKALSGYQQVFKEGLVKDYPLTIKHKNGRLTDVLYNASVYKDDKGKVLGVFAAARDVTKTKQASEYARSLIEASLDPLVTISTDGKVTDVNQATLKVTGVTKEKIIGSDFSDYFTEPNKARAGYQEAFKKGEVRDYLLTIRAPTGKLTNVLYNASVYKNSRGKVLGVFAAAREISRTELKAARARELMRTSKKQVFKVGLSYRLGKGTVKINERDCTKMGVGIVDTVTVKPTSKEIENRKLTVMSLSQTKYPEGMVVMNISDAKSLGLEEESTVFIIRGGTEQDIKFVDEGAYEGNIGEYEETNTEMPEEDNVEESKRETPFMPTKDVKTTPKKEVPEQEEEKVEETPKKEVPEQEEEKVEETPKKEVPEQEEEKVEETPKKEVPEQEEEKVEETPVKKAGKKEVSVPKIKEMKKQAPKQTKTPTLPKADIKDKEKKKKDFEAKIDALRKS
jgi:PAS domain S-box-containing protein